MGLLGLVVFGFVDWFGVFMDELCGLFDVVVWVCFDWFGFGLEFLLLGFVCYLLFGVCLWIVWVDCFCFGIWFWWVLVW